MEYERLVDALQRTMQKTPSNTRKQVLVVAARIPPHIFASPFLVLPPKKSLRGSEVVELSTGAHKPGQILLLIVLLLDDLKNIMAPGSNAHSMFDYHVVRDLLEIIFNSANNNENAKEVSESVV